MVSFVCSVMLLCYCFVYLPLFCMGQVSVLKAMVQEHKFGEFQENWRNVIVVSSLFLE